MDNKPGLLSSILSPDEDLTVIETYGACVFSFKGCRNIGILGEEKRYLRVAADHYGIAEPYGLCVECWDKDRGRCPGLVMTPKRIERKAFKELGITDDNWKDEAVKRNLEDLEKIPFLRKVLRDETEDEGHRLRPRHIYPGTCSICKKRTDREETIDEDEE
jgi:hypothetical protein